MSRFVSKPQHVDAVQWTGDNLREVLGDLGSEKIRYDADNELALLAGKDGAQEFVPVPVGHWLVHQADDLSDVWPVDPEYFATKYDLVGAEPQPDRPSPVARCL